MPGSYLKYYADHLTDWDWNPAGFGTAVLVVGLAVFLVSLGLNWRNWRNKPLTPDR